MGQKTIFKEPGRTEHSAQLSTRRIPKKKKKKKKKKKMMMMMMMTTMNYFSLYVG